MRLLLALILILPSVALGQIKDVTHPPGLVELKPDEVPEGATYRWKPVFPFDLKFREYLTLDAKQRVCLLDLDDPGKYVVDLLVINWENKQSYDVRHIIEIEGNAPTPPEPGPEPGPEPEPEPDDKLSGLAKAVRDEARRSVRAEVASRLADGFEAVSSMIAAGGTKTIRDAQYELRAHRAQSKIKDNDWSKLREMVDGHLEKHGRDVKAAGLIFEEIAKGLRAL
mgnify:CR=1 FL=1